MWADKVSEWVALGGEDGAGSEMRRFWMFALDPLPRVFGGVSPLAGLLQAACVLVLLRGVEMGKRVTTVMTAIKVIFVWKSTGRAHTAVQSLRVFLRLV